MLMVNNKFQEVDKEIDRAIRFPWNVVLEGESGVGKENFAKLIHLERNGRGELAVYDCEQTLRDQTRIVEQLTSLIFFERLQRFQQRETVFIRRVDLLPTHLLVRLSEFLWELVKKRIFSRNELLSLGIVGSLEKKQNKSSSNQVPLDKFLNGLFCYKIEIPPLRQRKEEIPWFVNRFISILNDQLKRNVIGVSPDALEVLLGYHWPNNLFELRAEIERAIILTEDYEAIKSIVLSERIVKSAAKALSLH